MMEYLDELLIFVGGGLVGVLFEKYLKSQQITKLLHNIDKNVIASHKYHKRCYGSVCDVLDDILDKLEKPHNHPNKDSNKDELSQDIDDLFDQAFEKKTKEKETESQLPNKPKIRTFLPKCSRGGGYLTQGELESQTQDILSVIVPPEEQVKILNKMRPLLENMSFAQANQIAKKCGYKLVETFRNIGEHKLGIFDGSESYNKNSLSIETTMIGNELGLYIKEYGMDEVKHFHNHMRTEANKLPLSLQKNIIVTKVSGVGGIV